MQETKAHVLARYWYCAEEGKLLFQGVKGQSTETKEKGSIVHNWLGDRPKNKTEQKLLALLEREKPFCREIHGIKIFGSPDDFRVNKKTVALEEFKSVHGFSSLSWFERFELCCASCQIKVYMWILEPILQKLGYKLSSEGHVLVYSYNGRFLKKYRFTMIERKWRMNFL